MNSCCSTGKIKYRWISPANKNYENFIPRFYTIIENFTKKLYIKIYWILNFNKFYSFILYDNKSFSIKFVCDDRYINCNSNRSNDPCRSLLYETIDCLVIKQVPNNKNVCGMNFAWKTCRNFNACDCSLSSTYSVDDRTSFSELLCTVQGVVSFAVTRRICCRLKIFQV